MQKKIPLSTKEIAKQLLLRGYTVKDVEDETGLSNGTIKAIIDSNQKGAEQEIAIQASTTPSTSDCASASTPAYRLSQLNSLRESGLISDEEYEGKRKEIINMI